MVGQRRDDVGAVRVVGDQRRARGLLVDVDVDQPVAQHVGRVVAAGEQPQRGGAATAGAEPADDGGRQ